MLTPALENKLWRRSVEAPMAELGAAMCWGLGVGLRQGSFFPKLVGVAPILLLQGSWWVIDATALAQGTRRHQSTILWGGCLGLGLVAGLAIVIRLGGW